MDLWEKAGHQEVGGALRVGRRQGGRPGSPLRGSMMTLLGEWGFRGGEEFAQGGPGTFSR